MHLRYIANIRLPTEKAHGIQIMHMCESFARMGAQVSLLVPRRQNRLGHEDPYVFYNREKNFRIVRIPCIDLLMVWPNRFVFWLQTFTFYLAAKLYVLVRGADLVYSRDEVAGIFFKNFLYEVHHLPHTISRIHRWLFKRARGYVALTRFIKERLVAAGIAAKTIFTFGDAVEIEGFAPRGTKQEARRALGLPEDAYLVGYVGSLKTMGMHKGIDTLIAALPHLPEKIQLVLVGGSPEDVAAYQEQAQGAQREHHARIHFVGRVPHHRIREYLQAFDLAAAPFPANEHYNYFMSPLKIFEYMASERPVLTTRLPSLLEIFTDQSAVLIEPDNADALAAGVRFAYENQETTHAMATNAAQLVRTYTWDARAKAILEFALQVNAK